MTARTELENSVFKRVDELEEELIKVALDLGDMDSSLPVKEGGPPNRPGVGDIKYHEKRAAQYVERWMADNGFETKRQGAPDRFNVLGTYRETGRGRSLLFCSHLDVMFRENSHWTLREPDLPHMVGAWRDGDSLVGQGIANCKGPMACWMISTKAIKDLGIQLPGDVLMSAVVGETGAAPVDELQSPQWDSHEVGARYVASHGGIADYALVAEATAFAIVPAMTGFAYFKVSIHTESPTYVPFAKHIEPYMETSTNALIRMAAYMERFERYAAGYTEMNTRSFDGGTMVPKGHVGAMRGGVPAWPNISPDIASIYCDFRIPPGNNPLDIQRDLEAILEEMGAEGTVEMFKFLPGYEAWHNKGFDTFKEALQGAHATIIDEPMRDPPSAFVSMWRDLNPYNEIGVPSVSYGFPTGSTVYEGSPPPYSSPNRLKVRIADMVKAAKIYASLTLDLCNRSTSDPA